MHWVVASILVGVAWAGPGSVLTGGPCTSDGDCRLINPYGILNPEARWNSTTRDYYASPVWEQGTCCGLESAKQCLDTRIDTCHDFEQNGLHMPTRCNTAWGVPCPGQTALTVNTCCNSYTQTCASVEDLNGWITYWCSTNKKMTPYKGWWIVGVPVLGTFFTLVAIIGCLLAVKDGMNGAGTGQKVVILLCLLEMVFSIFLYFSGAWKFGVVATVVSSLTLLSDQDKGWVKWVTFIAQFAAFTYFLGPEWNAIFVNFGDGIRDDLDNFCGGGRAYGNYFTYETQDLGRRALNNPQATQWGYCGRGWQTWLDISALLMIIWWGFLWVLSMALMFGAGAPPSDAQKGLLE